MTVKVIGLDIAKNVFQVHGVNETGEVILRRRLRRADVLRLFAGMEAASVGMEACSTAHYWARELSALGHHVRLMPPQFVKPYVKSQKNDAADAEAICEAGRACTGTVGSWRANCAAAYGLKGTALIFSGRLEEGRTSDEICLRLDPLDPNRASRFTEFAISQYFERNYEEAIKICRQAIRQYPNHFASYRFLLASLGQLGKHAECEALMEIAPAGYDHYARHRPPWFGLQDFEHMLEGLLKAGWSE